MKNVTAAVRKKGLSSATSVPAAAFVRPSSYAEQIEIYQLLRDVFHGPSPAEFQAQLEAPGYDPRQRIIVRHDREVVAHVRYLPTQMHYDAVEIPAVWLMDLATAPSFRKKGLATAVVAEAELQALSAGAVVGLVRTNEIDFFAKRGWGVCGQHSFSLVDACRLLATLQERTADAKGTVWKNSQPVVAVHIRPVRRLDLPELLRLETLRCRGHYGAFVRTQAQWEWLLERGACEVYVAEHRQRLAGYIVACEGRIAELQTEDPAAESPLLSHVARNAFENSKPSLRCDAPPGDPLHALCVAAGGRTICQAISGGEAYGVKVFDPQRLLELTSPVWRERAAKAQLGRTDELVIELAEDDGTKRCWQLNALTGKVTESKKAGSKLRVQLTAANFASLIFGQLTRAEQSREFSLAANSKRAAALAATLFPPLPLYFPAYEQLMAR